MSDSKSSALVAASLVLNLCTLAGMGYLVTHRTPQDDVALPTALSDMADDISAAKLEMKDNIEQLKSIIARLNTNTSNGSVAYNYDPAADLDKMSSDDLLKRWMFVCEVLSRNRHDPLQREPVEKERGRIEEQMRARGDASVASIAAKYKDIEDPWLQTRLITNVIDPMKSEAGFAFAKSVFEDTTYVGGLRLYAAQVVMKKDHDGTLGRLIDLLEHPDPAFDRRDQIVTFLKSNPDSRAAPVLISIAKADDSDRNLRTEAICALGSLPLPETIAALHDLAQLSKLGNLRIEAVRSLHKIQGKDVLDFAKKLREGLGPEDQMLIQFIDNIDAQYRTNP